MSGSSKRKARREMARARAVMTADAPAAFDKAALTKLADHIEREIVAGIENPPAPILELPELHAPLLVARVNREHEQRPSGKSYEEDNWDKLSPAFRDAHNRLLQARGLPTIPPPKVDNYKPPPPSTRKFVMADPEALAAARTFLRLPEGVPMIPGEESFSINGVRQK